MAHVFEYASSGRSKCRGCGALIQKGELRFGERLANPYAEGEMTLWFHPLCAALKRPDAMLELLGESAFTDIDREALERAAKASTAQRRLQRIDGAERAKASQANCRHCHERIEKGAWRIRLVFFEEGRFNPSGFIHFTCSPAYFENHEMLDHVFHFSPGLTDAEREELRREGR